MQLWRPHNNSSLTDQTMEHFILSDIIITDHNDHLKKIPNIPPIKIISGMFESCYLIDFEGNLWSFGSTLSLGKASKNFPKIVDTLKNIQQISYGSCGIHFIFKNSQKQIFAIGNNTYGQLGLGHNNHVSLPTPIPNLPKITQISCGFNLTVCVDCEGIMWSFGSIQDVNLGQETKEISMSLKELKIFLLFFLLTVDVITH